MGFRFRKSIKILPGVRINLSKSGPSLSIGGRGASVNVGGRGARLTLGIPGTGLYYTTQASGKKLEQLLDKDKSLDLNALERMTLSEEEKAFIEGVQAMSDGKADALEKLKKATHLADGAFFAGVVALHQQQWEDALQFMTHAHQNQADLGKLIEKYDLAAEVLLPITEAIDAHIAPNPQGVMLVLAEIYQAMGREAEAIDMLQGLYTENPEDVVVRVSLAELLLPTIGESESAQKIMKLAEHVENETAVHAALLLYRAMALRHLGMGDVAKDVLTATLRKKKDRPKELLLALRYELGMCHETAGNAASAKKEWQTIYAESPDFEDVAQKLGL